MREQLDSLGSQCVAKLDIWVSDDGSKDGTVELLETYKNGWNKGEFRIVNGPQEGYASNFLSLACNNNIKADFYAFCDQDDIWYPDKLISALRYIQNSENKTPFLYCSRTELIGASGNLLGLCSPLFDKKPSFRNALVQSLAGGNTMVFNQVTKKLLEQAGFHKIVSHDWWLYILVTSVEGEVVYDKDPHIGYRQHELNQIGGAFSWNDRLSRLKKMIKGEAAQRTIINLEALEKSNISLTDDNRRIFSLFKTINRGSLFDRIIVMLKVRPYRQTLLGNLALLLALLLKKI